MRLILFISTILLSYNFVCAQVDGSISIIELSDRELSAPQSTPENAISKSDVPEVDELAEYKPERQNFSFLAKKKDPLPIAGNVPRKQIDSEKIPVEPDDSAIKPAEKFHWKPALVASFYFLGIQHSLRMIQGKTRNELTGRFFHDWGVSVRNLSDWRDGDGIFTNYVAHPMQGAVTGRIFLNNSDNGGKQEFGRSRAYWESRFKAMAWSAVWSTQFELGPISEASIGNVGLYDRTGPNRMSWADIIITPVGGTGVLIGEDMIDKYILRKWLERGTSRTRIKIFRTFLTPFQSFTNVLGGRAPWRRYNR